MMPTRGDPKWLPQNRQTDLFHYIYIYMYLFLGPCGKQLPGSVCPLGMDHPPTGEEFVIGCAMCINTHSFWNYCTKFVFNKMFLFYIFVVVLFLISTIRCHRIKICFQTMFVIIPSKAMIILATLFYFDY